MTRLQVTPSRAGAIRAVWARRRWAFAAYLFVAALWIPARVGFLLQPPVCDTRLTASNAALSLTKVPHIALFRFLRADGASV